MKSADEVVDEEPAAESSESESDATQKNGKHPADEDDEEQMEFEKDLE
jgi:hypothetical protein